MSQRPSAQPCCTPLDTIRQAGSMPWEENGVRDPFSSHRGLAAATWAAARPYREPRRWPVRAQPFRLRLSPGVFSGEWCQEPFYFTLGFQPKQSGQFSIYITLQTRGQLAQLPLDQGARQRDQPMQPKNRGNAQSCRRKIILRGKGYLVPFLALVK